MTGPDATLRSTPRAAPKLSLHWDAGALWSALAPLLPGLSVDVLPRIGSTNTELLDRLRRAQPPQGLAHRRGEVAQGEAGLRRQADVAPCLLVAEHQTQGRGRSGKAWVAHPGASLTFSLGLPLNPVDWSGLSLAVGLALAEALDPAPAPAAPRLLLKWPNDLLLAHPVGIGRKLGGILIETAACPGGRYAVLGIGLNIDPSAARGPAAASEPGPDLPWGRGWLASLEPGLAAPQWLARLLPQLVQTVLAFERSGFAPLQARYARRDALLGQAVTAHGPAQAAGSADARGGLADGVDAQGALWIREGGQRWAVTSGEVSIRRPPPGGTADDGG